jgi:hypothetical protein
MIQVENREGRLVEIRLRPPILTAELDPARTKLMQTIMAIGRRVVIAVDFSKAKIWQKEHAEQLLDTMRKDNPMLERSGYFIPADSASVLLQFHRLIKDAQNPVRKAFPTIPEVYAYLDETLEDAEQKRLRAFFAEGSL